jgi:acyl carrier protein
MMDLGQSEPYGTGSDVILFVLMEALTRKLSDAGRTVKEVDQETCLLEIGVIDSVDLVDLILEVEQRSGQVFHPEHIDLEGGITVRKIAGAFAPVG